MSSIILSKEISTLINAHLLLLVHEKGRLLCVLLGGRIISSFAFDMVYYQKIMMMMLSRRLTCLIYSRYSSCPRRIFHLQRIVPKTAVSSRVGRVENGRFNALFTFMLPVCILIQVHFLGVT